ncbi:exonuclease SbcCD subunit D [Kallipyga massiliensis]|uniref:exonuclease SbcCD subunit D n=1 Tax=Kallipyga massiliensis TaxID=1472764 RepID=UPI0026E91D3B|nr:exonuclease SbcCD subunit D [Kallipyga massiliensis]
MKFFHLADLHLGKRVHDFSMLEDQEDILRQILDLCEKEGPDAVLLAGDIYDKSTPSAQAVDLLDRFLVDLTQRVAHVFMIPGNHDSPERLAFGSRLMAREGLHIAPPYQGPRAPYVLEDAHGPLYIHLLPYLRPGMVQAHFPDENITSYTEAVGAAIVHLSIDSKERNLLVAHQFVTGAERSDSERVIVGGSDNVSASVFEVFDYVALGHIHGPQNILSPRLRYAGSPLKYSFSEKNQVKSVTVVNLEEKGKVQVWTLPLIPKHDLREIRGKLDDLLAAAPSSGPEKEDYIRAILTDEETPPMALAKLRKAYPRIMRLDLDNRRTHHESFVDLKAREDLSDVDLFSGFYESQNGKPLSPDQKAYVEKVFKRIGEEDQ